MLLELKIVPCVTFVTLL